jgi:hypothetical protein
LDTSDLIDIADGRTAIGELLRAMSDTNTLLVISRAHVQDALNPNDDVARDKFIDAIQQFGIVLLVIEGPYHVEPLAEGRRDIRVESCSNIREVLLAGTGSDWLVKERRWQDDMHDASVGSAAKLVAKVPKNLVRKKAKELG